MNASSSGLGSAPATRPTRSGPRCKSSVGIDFTWCSADVRGFSSTFSLTIFTFPFRSLAACSSAGATARQGPHHGAQKSTSTGMGQSSTSRFQVASLAATGRSGNTLCLHRPHRGSSRRRLRGIRLRAPQPTQGYSMRSSSITDLRNHPRRRRKRGSGRFLQGRRVDAVALPRWRRSVLEDVTEVAAALAAVDLDALHRVRGVALGGDRPGIGRAREAGPARAALELVLGAKELRAASGAEEAAGLVIVPERARERALRALLPQDAVLLRRQLAPPLLIALLQCVVHGQRILRRSSPDVRGRYTAVHPVRNRTGGRLAAPPVLFQRGDV